MPVKPGSRSLARTARGGYVRWIQRSLGATARSVERRLREQALATTGAPDALMQRRNTWELFAQQQKDWADKLSAAMASGAPAVGTISKIQPRLDQLRLVDDDTIEREILASRLAVSIAEESGSEFTDVRSRLAHLENGVEMEPGDILRPQSLARHAVETWCGAGMNLGHWRTAQSIVHDELAHLAAEAFHEINRALVDRGVMPDVDLRPFIRRTPNNVIPLTDDSDWSTASDANLPVSTYSGGALGATPLGGSSYSRAMQGGRPGGTQHGHWGASEETRMMTRMPGLRRTIEEAQVVIARLNQLVGDHVPGFQPTASMVPMSPGLGQAIAQAAVQVRGYFPTTQAMSGAVDTPTLIAAFDERKKALKEAAETPAERAVIEIVALLFQSILTEERIPTAIRVWFARLQMPVLRVAVAEPDFFSGTDHPARRLIDRMGSCVLGFDRTASIGETLEKEIKRVVQVVEAYPDTGRRVFQTVLAEFEKFLSRYFTEENDASRVGISLAQQVEQKEIYTVQFTIELRKMLDEVPVQDAVRDFLFQVWADVLAMTATKDGIQSESTRKMKRVAAELIWSASAKVTREDRAEVIRKLPLMLKLLREGMSMANLATDLQDAHIQDLNGALQAAFTAKSATISNERMEELMMRLETLEDLLPDEEIEIGEDVILDLSGHESKDLEVVSEGGSMPNVTMVTWARQLEIGSWFRLDYKGTLEPVQLAWQGLRKQLNMFVTPTGRCVLFQQKRMAAFLQAGLLLPAEDESLTVRATRDALAKLDADPTRLMS